MGIAAILTRGKREQIDRPSLAVISVSGFSVLPRRSLRCRYAAIFASRGQPTVESKTIFSNTGRHRFVSLQDNVPQDLGSARFGSQ